MSQMKGSPPNIFGDEEFINILQELFQKLYLMISTWQRVLDDLRRHPSFSSIEEVLDYYGGAKVTTKK